MRDNFLGRAANGFPVPFRLPGAANLRYRVIYRAIGKAVDFMVECPSCHTRNPPESRLCSKCSTPFGIDSATLVADASPPPLVDPEVTQVFTEVSLAATAVGGTAGWSVTTQRSGAQNPNGLVEEGV